MKQATFVFARPRIITTNEQTIEKPSKQSDSGGQFYVQGQLVVPDHLHDSIPVWPLNVKLNYTTEISFTAACKRASGLN